MAYRIEYGPAIPEKYKKRYNPLRRQILTACFVLLFAFLVSKFLPDESQILRSILIPENGNAAQLALDKFVADMRCGESFYDAVYSFCEQIILSDPAIHS